MQCPHCKTKLIGIYDPQLDESFVRCPKCGKFKRWVEGDYDEEVVSVKNSVD